ncbi:MAG: hypothetical protein WHS89_09990 [Acidimicrobiales bacterium]
MTESPVPAEILAFVRALGEVFSTFTNPETGCVSFGILTGGRRWFVKAAATGEGAASLDRAVRLHRRVRHAAIVDLDDVLEGPTGPVLRYPWVDGTDLSAVPHRLDVEEVEHIVDVLFSAHVEVARHRFDANGLDEGCLLYDANGSTVSLIGLDDYDERDGHEASVVASLGRVAFGLLARADGDGRLGERDELVAVLERATHPDPALRFPAVVDLAAAWRAAASIAD